MNVHKNIDRRNFLRVFGTGAAVAVTGSSFNKTYAASDPQKITDKVPTDKMTYRLNPHSGEKVSLLGYGCMRWPTRPGIEKKAKEAINQEAVNDLVDYAIAHGVNYFDTAPVYGEGFSEHVTGIALSRHPRNTYFIATKMSNFDPSTQSFDGSAAIYHNSLKELQVDYIDYYLLHSIGASKQDFEARFITNGLLDFLQKERKAGRIRNLGWSFHGKKEVFDYVLNMDIKWDFVQIQLNYLDWQHASKRNVNAEYLYNRLVEKKIPVIVMEPLLGGRLAKLNNKGIAQLKAQNPQASAASWAFRYAGSLPEVLTVLSGMTYKEQLQENICTYSPLHPLNKQEKATLEGVALALSQSPTIPCTGCKYCLPCPQDIVIPDVFAHYNKCLTEQNALASLKDENYRKARQAFLLDYNQSAPKLKPAADCVGCNRCVPACPQSIKIPQEMQRINKFVEGLQQEKA
jgi:uncharacterized protein